MPIEFPCPTCRQQVRTPDAAAGKKGKCPNCGTVVIIPAPVVAVLPSQLPKPPPAPASPQSPKQPPGRPAQQPSQPAAGGPTEFPCPTCRQTVRTPASAAGKRGKCPHCQSVVQIPSGTPAPKPAAKPQAPPTLQPLAAPKPVPQKPVSRPPDDLPTLTPLAPTAQSVPGLTPLGPAPLASSPFGHAPANPFAGLTPLPPAPGYATPGLTPLGPAPASPTGGLLPLDDLPMLAPIPTDPLAGLPTVSPLGIPPASMGVPLNPYSSPAATSYAQPAYQPRQIHDGNRRGLAWENDPSMDSFSDTVNEVLGSPQEAFRKMRRSGGIGNPMGFFIIGGVIGQIASAIYSTIIQAIILAANGGVFPWEALIIYGAFQLIGGIIGIVIAGVVGMFISAAIGHLCLMMVGGANAGYEATYRVLCFGAGSVAVLNAIPIVGPLIGIFMTFVVLIHGYTHAHEIPGGKAAMAVFLPLFLVCCLCCTPGAFLSLGGLLSYLQVQP